MRPKDSRPNAYIDSVRQETSTYVKELMAEVEALSREAIRLEAERLLLEAELQARVQREQLLLEKLEIVRVESEENLSRFQQLEQHNTNLANLYVATHQLHSTLDRNVVIAAIQEIVVNLVGSEDFAILERNAASGEIEVVAAVGPLGRAVRSDDADVLRAFATGEAYISADPANDAVPACIPLSLDQVVIGAIAIRSLLVHKIGFEPLDRELFGLLASHASTALVSSALRERMPAEREVAQ